MVLSSGNFSKSLYQNCGCVFLFNLEQFYSAGAAVLAALHLWVLLLHRVATLCISGPAVYSKSIQISLTLGA